MDKSHWFLTSLSREFLSLCQAQVSLLTHAFKANWVGVYLTENFNPENPASTNLIPAYLYPPISPNFSFLSGEENHFLYLNENNINTNYLSPDLETSLNLNLQNNQIVIPLLYEDIFMGLLVVKRNEPAWNQLELTQIEKIATTLAIACSWEKSKGWYQQRLQELEHLINFTDHKIADLLHQLRNPLTALRTFTKLLLKRLLPEDNNNKIVQNILRESDRLQQLLHIFQQEEESNNTLTGSVISSANFLLPAQSSHTADLNTIIVPLIESAIAQAEEKNIGLEVKLKSGIFVQGNAQAIQEVFSNLIDNAVKYTPNGGQIKIDSVEQENYEGIKIADSGYGIPLEDQERIFERKYRGKQQEGPMEGSGLGLAIVKNLVEQMGGKIELISPNDLNGSTFILWLKTINN